jgi:hypothetical protein
VDEGMNVESRSQRETSNIEWVAKGETHSTCSAYQKKPELLDDVLNETEELIKIFVTSIKTDCLAKSRHPVEKRGPGIL